MTRLFDGDKANRIKKTQATQIAVYVCVCAILLTAAVLFSVFYKQLSRKTAQLLTSVCLAGACCYTVLFADYMIYYKRILNICRAEKSVLQGKIKIIESATTTYRSLPCKIVEVSLNNVERRLYLYEGAPEEGKEYEFEIAQNIICGYGEIK